MADTSLKRQLKVLTICDRRQRKGLDLNQLLGGYIY